MSYLMAIESRDTRTDAWIKGKSAAYLRKSGQIEDLEFILAHIDDLQAAFALRDGEVIMEAGPCKRPSEKEHSCLRMQ